MSDDFEKMNFRGGGMDNQRRPMDSGSMESGFRGAPDPKMPAAPLSHDDLQLPTLNKKKKPIEDETGGIVVDEPREMKEAENLNSD
jgi:hypothetical protein